MTRLVRKGKAAGPYAGLVPGRMVRTCSVCGAPPFERCRKWKMEKGERVAIMRSLAKMHQER